VDTPRRSWPCLLPCRSRSGLSVQLFRQVRGLEEELVLEEAVRAEPDARGEVMKLSGWDGLATLRTQGQLRRRLGDSAGDRGKQSVRAGHEATVREADDPIISSSRQVHGRGADNESVRGATLSAVRVGPLHPLGNIQVCA
jgi:hypothetical protein